MKNNDWAGLGNHTSAEFWEYDTRTGKRANQDPNPNPSWSYYSTFGDNPIWHYDYLGDTAGTSMESAGGAGTDVDPIPLNDVPIAGARPMYPTSAPRVNVGFDGYNLMEAAQQDINRNDEARKQADMADQAAMLWTGVGAAPLAGVAAVETAPIWAPWALGPKTQ